MPYKNKHTCRLQDPSGFQKDSYKQGSREYKGKRYDVLFAKKIGKETSDEQAYQYPADIWTEEEAREHSEAHKSILFEPAAGDDTTKEEATMPKTVEELTAANQELETKLLAKDKEIASLEAEKKELQGQVKDLDKKATVAEEKLNAMQAQNLEKEEAAAAAAIMDEALAASKLSENEKAKSKVKAGLDWKSFRVEGEQFSATSTGGKKFADAVKAEIEDWEALLPAGNGGSIGTGLPKDTKTKGSMEEEDDRLVKNLR